MAGFRLRAMIVGEVDFDRSLTKKRRGQTNEPIKILNGEHQKLEILIRVTKQ